MPWRSARQLKSLSVQVVGTVEASLTPAPARSQLVFDAVRPSLVLIRSLGKGDDASHEPGTTPGPGGGLGTGVVVDRDGRILTSLHVVDDAVTIEVTFADGTESTATIEASQPEDDIAVLVARYRASA